MISDEDLARLEALAAKASPGPWTVRDNEDDWTLASLINDGCDPPVEVCCSSAQLARAEADAAFIAAVRDAVPVLCAEVRRLRAEREAMDALIKGDPLLPVAVAMATAAERTRCAQIVDQARSVPTDMRAIAHLIRGGNRDAADLGRAVAVKSAVLAERERCARTLEKRGELVCQCRSVDGDLAISMWDFRRWADEIREGGL